MNSIKFLHKNCRLMMSTLTVLGSLLILPLLLLVFQPVATQRYRCNRALRVRLRNDSIVPDIIDFAPNEKIVIKYLESGVQVNLGNELKPRQVKDEPRVMPWTPNCYPLYTLALIDPDAPSRADPEYAQILHWLVVNIPGYRVSRGTTMAEYIGSAAPNGTGLHRYIFLIYKQPGRINPDEKKIPNTTTDGRTNFKIRDYAKKYNLGNPIAVNYFQAQYDDYVPILEAQLGIE